MGWLVNVVIYLGCGCCSLGYPSFVISFVSIGEIRLAFIMVILVLLLLFVDQTTVDHLWRALKRLYCGDGCF